MRQLKITKQITNFQSYSLKKYLYEISKIPQLSAEEEVSLAKKIHDGDEEALTILVNANLRFVVSVAKQYQNQGLSFEDIISEGNLGLIKAAVRFDETRGFKFISYAVWWIRQSIMHAIDEHARIVRMPFNKIQGTGKVQNAFKELEQKFQREPTSEEISDHVDMSLKEVKECRKASNYNLNKYVSLDAPVIEEENHFRRETLLSNKDFIPDSQLINSSLKKDVKRSLALLSEREAMVISLYFGLNEDPGYSLDDIGTKLNITRERVRQIKEDALKKLKKPEHRKNLNNYLISS